jgi:cell division protein FtsI/penicillin-binding protein 2
VTPHLGDSIITPEGRQPIPFAQPRNLRLDPELLSEIRDGLLRVTHSSRGTAYSVFSKFTPAVAGKTGTAQFPPKDDYAWFAGWAPADNPKLVVVALIEQGGHGGVAAAPAALRVFQSYFHPGAKLPTVVGHDSSR